MNSYKGTIQKLINIELDVLKQCKASPWFAHSNKESVERFYKFNSDALLHFKETVDTLNASFVKKDNNGDILLVPGENGKMQQVFINDEAEKVYRQQMEYLGKTPIDIFY